MANQIIRFNVTANVSGGQAAGSRLSARSEAPELSDLCETFPRSAHHCQKKIPEQLSVRPSAPVSGEKQWGWGAYIPPARAGFKDLIQGSASYITAVHQVTTAQGTVSSDNRV